MPLCWNFCALGIGEHQHVRDRRLRILLAFGLDAVGRDLLFEVAEIGVSGNLERHARALRLRAFAQHDRMMVHRGSEIDRIVVLGRDREPENIGIIFGLPIEIGRLVAGVGDFADADHANSPSFPFFRILRVAVHQ
jgi:hypothetical protein